MKNKTDITFILDRSGSMDSIKSDTIGGFNSFLKEQKAVDGEAVVSLYQFDDKYDVIYEAKNLKDAPELTDKTFVPRGMTALHDAIGKTLVLTGERLASLPEKERPNKVLCIILTDGQENASKEYTSKRISEMLKHQENVYNWEFIFLGANQDAILTARGLGISASKSMTYTADSYGVGETYRSLSKNVASYRTVTGSSASLDFNDEDRNKQKINMKEFKIGDKVKLKSNFIEVMDYIGFEKFETREIYEEFSKDIQEIFSIWYDKETKNQFASIDLCVEIPTQCLEAVKD